MIRTQIQLPDTLYNRAREIAKNSEISLAELCRRGLEYIISVSPSDTTPDAWELPPPRHLGGNDPFQDDNWRMNLHMNDTRLAAILLHHGVQDFATRNLKDFRAVGFRRVWDPTA